METPTDVLAFAIIKQASGPCAIKKQKFNEISFDECVDEAKAPALSSILILYHELLELCFLIILLTSLSEFQHNSTKANLLFAGYYSWEKLIPSYRGFISGTITTFISNSLETGFQPRCQAIIEREDGLLYWGWKEGKISFGRGPKVRRRSRGLLLVLFIGGGRVTGESNELIDFRIVVNFLISIDGQTLISVYIGCFTNV